MWSRSTESGVRSQSMESGVRSRSTEAEIGDFGHKFIMFRSEIKGRAAVRMPVSQAVGIDEIPGRMRSPTRWRRDGASPTPGNPGNARSGAGPSPDELRPYETHNDQDVFNDVDDADTAVVITGAQRGARCVSSFSCRRTRQRGSITIEVSFGLGFSRSCRIFRSSSDVTDLRS